MTPNEFQTSAIAWIKAVSEVLAVAAPIAGGIVLWVRGQVAKLKAVDASQQTTIDATKGNNILDSCVERGSL